MRRFLILGFLTVLASTLYGEEGMWTFDNLPLQSLQQRYGFTPTEHWLTHVRFSCVRFSDGGSGSFISPNGLVLTNHHVARGQLQKSSSREHDYVAEGFYARSRGGEIKSPDLYVDVLVSVDNVTKEVLEKTAHIESLQEQATARRSLIAKIEQDSKQQSGLEAQVVALYGGGEYWLYRYKRYTDVRIVFAPEQQAAFFGGDPDNFTYPPPTLSEMSPLRNTGYRFTRSIRVF